MDRETPPAVTKQVDSSELRAQLEQCHQASYGWALHCCSQDPVQAQEVLQTVYLKVLEGKARFDGRASFKTWLFSVIRKTAADERRRMMFRRFILIKLDESNEHNPQEEDLDETIERSNIQVLLQRSLAALSKRQQEVLHLVFYQNMTLAAAAAVMGLSIGSARTHYERGKQRLRQQLEMSGVFDGSELGHRKNQGIIPRIETEG